MSDQFIAMTINASSLIRTQLSFSPSGTTFSGNHREEGIIIFSLMPPLYSQTIQWFPLFFFNGMSLYLFAQYFYPRSIPPFISHWFSSLICAQSKQTICYSFTHPTHHPICRILLNLLLLHETPNPLVPIYRCNQTFRPSLEWSIFHKATPPFFIAPSVMP